MGSDSGKLLADAIKAHTNFEQIAQNMFDGKTKVDMSKQGLDAGDAHIMAAALEKNDTVTQVHASGNDFGQAGGEAFAKALESNTHLAELVLGSKDEPASIPLKELRDNAIDSLDYSGKKLLAEGGIVLAFALKSNTSVTKVSKQHAAL